jgi:hypothetical protein
MEARLQWGQLRRWSMERTHNPHGVGQATYGIPGGGCGKVTVLGYRMLTCTSTSYTGPSGWAPPETGFGSAPFAEHGACLKSRYVPP